MKKRFNVLLPVILIISDVIELIGDGFEILNIIAIALCILWIVLELVT